MAVQREAFRAALRLHASTLVVLLPLCLAACRYAWQHAAMPGLAHTMLRMHKPCSRSSGMDFWCTCRAKLGTAIPN